MAHVTSNTFEQEQAGEVYKQQLLGRHHFQARTHGNLFVIDFAIFGTQAELGSDMVRTEHEKELVKTQLLNQVIEHCKKYAINVAPTTSAATQWVLLDKNTRCSLPYFLNQHKNCWIICFKTVIPKEEYKLIKQELQ